MARSVCVIPSRAGTKNKGLWLLRGEPLVEWVIRAAGLRKTIVATDQPELNKAYCARWHNTHLFERSPELADGGHMVETLIAVADQFELSDDTIMHVCQPSSPFLRSWDLEKAEEILGLDTFWSSVQTVIPVPHNFHEWNQRKTDGDLMDFVNRARRLKAKTKQMKPARWAFGNLVSVRVGALRSQNAIFAKPSCGWAIPRWYGLDVDDRADLRLAEAYLAQGLVTEEELRA